MSPGSEQGSEHEANTPGTELEAPKQIVDPLTGELLVLGELSVDRLALGQKQIQLFEERLRDVKRAIADEAHRRMDSSAKWTLEADGWKVAGEAPGKVDYNPERLKDALDLLLEDGRINQEAYDAAIEEVVTYKPKVRGIKALLKLGPDVAELILEAQDPRPDHKRRLTITPPKRFWEELDAAAAPVQAEEPEV